MIQFHLCKSSDFMSIVCGIFCVISFGFVVVILGRCIDFIFMYDASMCSSCWDVILWIMILVFFNFSWTIVSIYPLFWSNTCGGWNCVINQDFCMTKQDLEIFNRSYCTFFLQITFSVPSLVHNDTGNNYNIDKVVISEILGAMEELRHQNETSWNNLCVLQQQQT